MRDWIRGFLGGGLYVLCNYVITNIPCWVVRKLLYRMLGMKIGSHSRIMMKVIVTHPWKIRIGENTTINEYCYLDGRGGVTIGDNCTIALRSMLVTGTHDHRAKGFDYLVEPIKIGNGVWVAANAMVLNGCTLGDYSLVSAGAVVMPRMECESNCMYGGVPAKKIKERGLNDGLELKPWRMLFR